MKSILVYAVIVLQIIDLITTYIALQNPKNREANPLVEVILNAVGVLPGLLLTKGTVVALFVIFGKSMPMWISFPVTGIYVWAVINNIGVIRK